MTPLSANDKRNHKTTVAFPALCAKGSMIDDVGMLVFHLLFDSCYTIHWFGREKNIETDWVTLKIYQPKHAIPDCSICIDCKNLSDQTFMDALFSDALAQPCCHQLENQSFLHIIEDLERHEDYGEMDRA